MNVSEGRTGITEDTTDLSKDSVSWIYIHVGCGKKKKKKKSGPHVKDSFFLQKLVIYSYS